MVPKTLLEWVIEQHWGPPVSRSANGRATWQCQFHDDTNPSFSTLPPNPTWKDRYRCFGCGARGDIYDFVKEMHPGDTWPERQARVEHYRQQFERQTGPAVSPSGDGESQAKRAVRKVEPDSDWETDSWSDRVTHALNEVWEAIADRDKELEVDFLTFGALVLTVCAADGLHPGALADRLGEAAYWARLDAEHMAECADPECDNVCCRKARGWTDEQIEAALKQQQRAREKKR